MGFNIGFWFFEFPHREPILVVFRMENQLTFEVSITIFLMRICCMYSEIARRTLLETNECSLHKQYTENCVSHLLLAIMSTEMNENSKQQQQQPSKV